MVQLKRKLFLDFFTVSNMEPVSRDYLRGLKAQTDESARIHAINKVVEKFYNQIILAARTKKEKHYHCTVARGEFPAYHQDPESYYIKSNILDILKKLQELFPDCLVEFKTVIVHSEEEWLRKFQPTVTFENQVINIDWS